MSLSAAPVIASPQLSPEQRALASAATAAERQQLDQEHHQLREEQKRIAADILGRQLHFRSSTYTDIDRQTEPHRIQVVFAATTNVFAAELCAAYTNTFHSTQIQAKQQTETHIENTDQVVKTKKLIAQLIREEHLQVPQSSESEAGDQTLYIVTLDESIPQHNSVTNQLKLTTKVKYLRHPLPLPPTLSSVPLEDELSAFRTWNAAIEEFAGDLPDLLSLCE